MSSFLLELPLLPFTDELIALIPEHRSYVNGLFEDGTLKFYAVSESRDLIWCVAEVESAGAAKQLVREMPLFPAIRSIKCRPLMFSQGQSASLPGISMN